MPTGQGFIKVAPSDKAEPMWRDDPVLIWLAAGIIGSLSGFAALLRTNQRITTRRIATALLCAAMCAMGCVAALYHYHGDEHLWLTIAVSVLAGFGANGVIDVSVALFVRYIRERFE